MSALSDKITAEHLLETFGTAHRGLVENDARCTCGEPLPWYQRDAAYHVHLLEAVEAAVRAQIAADIRSTFTDPEQRRPRDPAGEFATDLLNDWQWAELIAKGGA